MARIQRTFTTDSTAEDMKDFINRKVLTRTELTALLPASTWRKHILYLDSRFVNGTVQLQDHEIKIDIDISFMAASATKKIEAAIEDGIKQLKAGE